MSTSNDFPVVRTEEMTVLTVRRMLADQTEVAQALAELLPKVIGVIAGPPLALQIGFPRDGKTPYDLAFPVREAIGHDGFELKMLPSLPMFSITHKGPLTGGHEGTNLSYSWGSFARFVSERSLLLGDDPVRFIYHDGLESVGTDAECVHLEIQYPYHLPMWLAAFREGVTHCAGGEAVRRVLEGSEGLTESLDGKRAAEWVQGAVERLDQEIPDERTRAHILNACAHHYIVQSGEVLATLWEQSGHDLRVLMQKISEEPLLGSAYWIDESDGEAILYICRRPARMEAYEQANDPVEKRYQACFCPLVRDAIRDKKTVSRTFCHCSSGWYMQEWEPIFGEKPRVDLVETMIEGADACLFAVRIPPGFL